MSIGRRIIQIRNQKGISQRQLSERSGLATSYLSRIENQRLEPGAKTLRKIARALDAPISRLFEEGRSHKLDQSDQQAPQCPISVSGNCVLELLDRGKRALPKGAEHYSARQLQLLREAAYLIQTADTPLLDTLNLLFGALVSAPSSNTRHKAKLAR